MSQIYVDGIGWVDDGGMLGPPGGFTPDQQAAISAGFDPSYAGAQGVPNAGSAWQSNIPAATNNNPAPPTTTPDAFYGNANLAQLLNNYQTNNGLIGQNDYYTHQLAAGNMDSLNAIQGYITQQGASDQTYLDQSRALTGQLGSLANSTNASALQNLGNYTGQVNNLNNFDMGTYGQLAGTYNQLATPLQSSVSWNGDLTSQAAIADPTALAAQNNALGMLGGIAGGSLDYTSQGAQAYADPKYTAMVEQGLGDLYGASQGSKDVHPGQEDPQAYAAALDAMGQLKSLTTPTVTDAERFIYEQARQAQEQDERANAGASLANMRQRGVAGGAEELVNSSMLNQQASQNRLLSDLGAQANAVNRSMAALQGYSGIAQNLNDEGNALGTANANRQLQALGLYTDESGQLRSASFDESYKRGIAADNASANNQSTRLAGTVNYGNQANTMQQQAYQRGAAADQTAQFNRQGQLDVSMFNNNFAQNERNAQWDRAQGLANTGLNASGQIAFNDANIFNGTNSINDANYNRSKSVIDANDIVNTRQWTAATNQTTRNTDFQNQVMGNNALFAGGMQAGNNARIQNGNQLTNGLIQNNTQAMGNAQAQEALKNAERLAKIQADADPGGILGTGILGKNGILGLEGVPIL
jgi:hypothetical protein